MADFLLLAYCVWCFLSFALNHGLSGAIQPGGILFVETMGSYMLARCYVRDRDDFRNMVRLSAMFVVCLLPFVFYEAITGQKPILDAFRALAPTFQFGPTEMRAGLRRAQGPFEHPILFGFFCASLFALMHLAGGKEHEKGGNRLVTASVVAAAFLSLSSAPIASVVIQGALICWNWLLRQYSIRWKLLWAAGFAGYLVIEFGSNQTPASFYVTYFTFDRGTGWYRLWTWDYATASVANHPIWGIGFSDWVRPAWMASGSIDNFWLVIAVRHGIPAIALMLGVYFSIALAVGFNANIDSRNQNFRLAYLLCMAVFFFVGSTVYFWAASYVWFLFLLGCGTWLLDVKPANADERATSRRPARASSSGSGQRRGDHAPAALAHDGLPGKAR